ncbi:hypothetical protein [Catellatospora tritici]|uniref:hypothetical protein n=1 Tax=Catellatospora tritici TaxID=2851566 RepID=UPI001C2D2E94|nr:hypothetical protein [Catellatospora tritici]MBV1851349.1 hypothetical protein [Catellatospora tritici]
MKTRIGMRRWAAALLAAPLVALIAAAIPGSASAEGDGGHNEQRDHWGVITRNTIGSPVADLRNGPFGTFGVVGPASRPPYGQGSLGIEVADNSTTLTPHSEKIDFGNEVDFYGKLVSGLTQVGFHVFQTDENISYGGAGNMPNIRFEIDPNLAALPTTTYSTLVWLPAPAPVTNRWSGYLDATTSGTWFLTGAAGTATGCNLTTPCTFTAVKAALNADGGDPATIYTAAVGKGRDFMWIGAIDGLRINNTIYDFEVSGVRQRPAA